MHPPSRLVFLFAVVLTLGCGSSSSVDPSDAGAGGTDAGTAGTGGTDAGTGGTGAGGTGGNGGAAGDDGCEVGYEGNPCTWGVVPDDPGFMETPSPWIAVKGPLLEPDAQDTFDLEPGRAFFPPDSICAFGSVSQTITMPTLQNSQAFIAQVSLRVRQETPSAQSPSFALGMNGSWTFEPVIQGSFLYSTRELCLGEAAYGGNIEMRLSNWRDPFGCPDTNASLDVGRIQIVPAADGQCPAPATVLNGDFEGEGGWEAASADGASAGIEEGVGSNGSRAGRLTTPSPCKNASLLGKLSVPSPASMPSPAIRFSWSATVDTRVRLWVDDTHWDGLQGTGETEEAFYCLPPWTAGSVHSIRAWMDPTGTCAVPHDWDFVMDDFEVVNEPACGASEGIFDPGFESAPISLLGEYVADVPGVRAVVDPSLAHSGNGVLELARSKGCYGATYEPFVIPLPPDEVGGPALRYWYRVLDNPNTETRIGTEDTEVTVDETGIWSEGLLCLDPNRVGRPLKLRLILFGGSFPCEDFGTTDVAYFDDLELTTDPACPSM